MSDVADSPQPAAALPSTRPGGPVPCPPVVGIGASAGGLKALQQFFEQVPADSGMAFVVIMHLDAERESRAAAILQERTLLPVAQVTGEAALEADHVYVIAPGRDLVVRDGVLGVVERGEGPHAPVDLFFRTLAVACGPDAAAVVLSGTGSDGTSGIRYVKEAGGVTVAQLPEEAEYDGMPVSAMSTGQVDLVLPAADIPAELVRLRRMPSPLSLEAPPPDTEAQLAAIFAVLKRATRHDFSLYKRSTVLRRLERRLRFNEVNELEAYLPLLVASPAEVRALERDLLISVSGFFRDPASFAALERVIPPLFEDKGLGDTVRVWVAGCATGEEAYSLSILLHEHAATLRRPPRIQMFATDIDETGYAWGREALYPAAAMVDIAPARLGAFFVQEPGGYRVKKSLREGVLFAVHNVLHDPPFSRIDLVSCRNLLIYLQPAAQEQVLETFHYALRPNGVLFLGSSESAGDSGLFTPVAARERIYRRDASAQRALPRATTDDLPPRIPEVLAGAAGERRPQPLSYGAHHLRLLEAYAPPSLVVNERLEVVHLSGRAGRYLRLAGGAPTHNLIDLVRGELRMELRTALYQAFAQGVATSRRVRVDDEQGEPRAVTLEVRPSGDGDEGGARYALVVFGQAEPDASAGEPDGDAGAHAPGAAAVARLDEELRRTRELLEHTSAARDQTVEELQAANEELRSINEEQRAASEELETSREEVQSVNEELTTINQEHQATIEELKRANADLHNLIESTGIGTIFVDRELRVRRYTPPIGALFNFVATDRGRPLAHITHRLGYPALLDDTRRVLATLEPVEREARSEKGEWYMVRIGPYRSPDGGYDGAVLTFVDITAQKGVEAELREAREAADLANRAKGTFLATLAHEFRTPLNGMLGYADVLPLIGPLTPGQGQKVDRIRAGGRHLAAMIDQILVFAKLDEGRELVRPERLDAREVAREARELVEPAADARGLAFALEVPDRAVELVTDAGKIRQVLVNLCGNAVKYTGEGEVRLVVREEPAEVVFEVRDTGIGIALEHQERVFDRFWQVEGAATRSMGGMGIGLAAAREFSRLLGGEVELESEPGRGSTFRVRLPRTRGGG